MSGFEPNTLPDYTTQEVLTSTETNPSEYVLISQLTERSLSICSAG